MPVRGRLGQRTNRESCIGRILAYLSAGHHAGLPDWHSVKTGNAALPIRLEEGRKNLEHIRDFAREMAPHLRPVNRPPPFVKKSEDFHLWVRMLFSCLVDADRLDTEKFADEKNNAARGDFPTLGTLAPTVFPSTWKNSKRRQRQRM